MSAASKSKSTQLALGALAAVATASLVYYLLSKSATAQEEKKSSPDETPQKKNRSVDVDQTPLVKNGAGTTPAAEAEAIDSNKQLHAQIEELDKKGKAFFKGKQVRAFIIPCLSMYCCFVKCWQSVPWTCHTLCACRSRDTHIICSSTVHGSRPKVYRSLGFD